MVTGWLAWTCLLLGAGAPGDAEADVYHTNQRNFTIPIRIDAHRRGEVSALLLYLSRDQGRTWEVYGRAAPDKPGFDFFTQNDGLYYFSIAVIDQKGRQDPVDIPRAKVGQKISIDTVKPVVKIVSAERSGDEIVVNWEIQEDRPEWTTLKLEYRVGDSPTGPWTPLMVEPGDHGNKRFRPGLPGPVTVRLSLRDLAKNEGADEKVVGHYDRAVVGAGAAVPVGATGDSPAPPPPPPPPPPSSSSVGPPPLPSTGDSGPAPLAHSSAPLPRPGATGSEPASPMPTRGPLANLQIVNKHQVKLGFNVGKFGPSGLGTVDVYVSTDEGATWEKAPGDPSVSLPVSPMGTASVKGTVTVSLPKEGVRYGFYLVIKSRAGLGKDPPRPGDAPHVRIEADMTPPDAELFAPQPAPGEPNRLILRWKAQDRNPTDNPISLEWAAQPSGPWTFIGDSQLPNNGSYTWAVTEQVPHKVYLKLSVRDAAGNIAVAQTDKPVLIDLYKPELVDGSVVVEREK
jgi:hypothetical protein